MTPRDRILRSAAELYAARGVDATGLRDVARAAGMSLGGLQIHFPARAQLLLEVARAAAVEARTEPDDSDGWARLWLALRVAAFADATLRAELDGAELHPTRLLRLADLMIGGAS